MWLLLDRRCLPDAAPRRRAAPPAARGVPRDGRAAVRGRDGGVLSPFQAFMTALGASIGTGNIAGVATAIISGGPGALFWIWVYGFVATAIKFSEAVLGVRFRETQGDTVAVRPDVLPARRAEVAGARVDLRARRRRRRADDDAVHAAELDRASRVNTVFGMPHVDRRHRRRRAHVGGHHRRHQVDRPRGREARAAQGRRCTSSAASS